MIEKKIMWGIDPHCTEPYKALVLLEDGKPTHETKWNESDNSFLRHMSSISKETRFFDSREEAAACLSARKPSPEEIDRVMDWFYRDQKAFEEAFNRHFGETKWKVPGFISDRFDDDEEELPSGNLLDAIKQYIREGTLNMDACTFHKGNVLYVDWGPDNEADYDGFHDPKKERPIRIILQGGRTVYPRSKEERWFAKLAFGGNYNNGIHYNDIEIPDIND